MSSTSFATFSLSVAQQLCWGPRQSGKSTLAWQLVESQLMSNHYSLDDDDLRSIALSDPSGFIAGVEYVNRWPLSQGEIEGRLEPLIDQMLRGEVPLVSGAPNGRAPRRAN